MAEREVAGLELTQRNTWADPDAARSAHESGRLSTTTYLQHLHRYTGPHQEETKEPEQNG